MRSHVNPIGKQSHRAGQNTNPETSPTVKNRPETERDISDKQVTAAHFLGSTILLCGRGLSLALNLGVQILIVRYLTKLEYGYTIRDLLSIGGMAIEIESFGQSTGALNW